MTQGEKKGNKENPGNAVLKEPGAAPLKGARVWVCVHCGTINPAGPGRTCPHYHMACFGSLDGDALESVQRLSEARLRMHEELARFNKDLKQFVEQGSAAIEPSTRGRSIDLYSSMPPDEFELVRPEPKKKKKTAKPDSTAERQKPRPKKRRREPEVDPRQLVLLDYLPEGEA